MPMLVFLNSLVIFLIFGLSYVNVVQIFVFFSVCVQSIFYVFAGLVSGVGFVENSCFGCNAPV